MGYTLTYTCFQPHPLNAPAEHTWCNNNIVNNSVWALYPACWDLVGMAEHSDATDRSLKKQLTFRRKGQSLCVLVGEGNGHSTKMALKMARAFLHPEVDQLHLVTSIAAKDDRIAAELKLESLVEADLAAITSVHVVVKEDEFTQFESLARYLINLGLQLIVMSSTNLCAGMPAMPAQPKPAPLKAPGKARQPEPPPAMPRPSSGCVALKILADLLAVRSAPVLLVKYNSRGPFLSGATPSIKCMVDLQANSRHLLEWLFEKFEAGRDHIMLTVSQAYDERNQPKPLAERLLTAFGVQAAVNSFHADKAMLKDAAHRALPKAVVDAAPDVLVLQAPRCRGLPSQLTELLYNVKTSILLWPADNSAH